LAHALVPLKHLVQAKTRLAEILDPSQRLGLARAMAEDVLRVLAAHPDIETVTLISDDPTAGQLAELCGARCWPEQAFGTQGLNPLLRAACERLGVDSGQLLVLHADLPLLSAADVTAALALQRLNGGVIVGCDRHDAGTNLLGFEASQMPEFRFGQGSCRAHSDAAMSAGLSVHRLRRPGIALDIDEASDLRLLLHSAMENCGEQTRSYLGSLKRSAAALNFDAEFEAQKSPEAEALAATADPADTAANWERLSHLLRHGHEPNDREALTLASIDDTAQLSAVAMELRDIGHGNVVTYSRKVFVPLTHLCRDVCHYCTFAKTPKKIDQPYMSIDEVVALCREGAKQGCQEALFTLGEKPELRYSAARKALEEMGYASTLDYLRAVASRVLEETGLLPHINAGCMTAQEISELRQVSASMGIMLESTSERLCQKGMPHYGSPDKIPARRLETLELAGQASVPFTSGILIGIGETRVERIESLLALRRVHRRHGHLQEVIVQNFRAKPDTLMASAPEPDLNELLWTIAVARLIFGAHMNIQAPPNLSPGVLPQIVAAGINDWGGVSPVTPDHVNPEAPWPHLDQLAAETAAAGKFLEQRLTIYPTYVRGQSIWLDDAVRQPVRELSDSAGFARRDPWATGAHTELPQLERQLLDTHYDAGAVSADVADIVTRCKNLEPITEADITRLFNARGRDFSHVVRSADHLRRAVNGDTVSYVVNRNINYTNVCYFKCHFCAFSKGKQSENLRGKPYDISAQEISVRCHEAWDRGATEVCMQGGIHPNYTGQTYLDIVETVRQSVPGLHIHAFSPLEVWQGAATLGIELTEFLQRLKTAGLSTLPGTAAEILHDEVRATLCPDKINTAEWLEVMSCAHDLGMRTTATIMYGHVEEPRHWSAHLMRIRELQQRSGGFTEFVPLPFVAAEAPMYLRGGARPGPTFREAILMHAVARLAFHGLIDNIQASWVKMGPEGVAACLQAGVNDLGGSLMNESITRAAGSDHGQEWAPAQIEDKIRSTGRQPRMRNTLYGDAAPERRVAAMSAGPVRQIVNELAGKRQRSKRLSVPGAPLEYVSWVRSSNDSGLYEQVILRAACN
jgi:FO synthase